MPSPDTSRRPVILVGVLLALLVLAYGAFRAMPYLIGPVLAVTSPLPNEATSSPVIQISGNSQRVAYLSINDMEVPLHEDGSFEVLRALPKGYTVVTLLARDKFGRERVVAIPIVGTGTLEPLPSNATTTHGIQTEGQSTTSTSTGL